MKKDDDLAAQRQRLQQLRNILYTEDIILRPPNEANSILIELATGCSYSRCTFCRENARPHYFVLPLDDVLAKIKIHSQLPENQKRRTVFLLGENTLTLPFDYLQTVFAAIGEHLPHVRQINMYARAADVLNKSREELVRLKEMGLTDLYIGVESGSDQILKMCKKGTTTKLLLKCLYKLDDLGLTYSLSSIMGLGGQELSYENATMTAQFYNKVHPRSLRLMTLRPEKGSELYAEIEAGRFHPVSTDQAILEERLLLGLLEVKNCIVYGNHFSNPVPLFGLWPGDKAQILHELDAIISELGLEQLEYQPSNDI